MLEGLRDALQYVVGLGNEAEKAQVLEICGETYANKNLVRYGARSIVPVLHDGLYQSVQ